jgi:2-polyprenyl-6-methoxyphenol hydroxylase-like FAD-dependent oxidoreductase
MAGLLAALALSDFFETVTVVERDLLPDQPTNRRGVPHSSLHQSNLCGRCRYH